MFKRILKSIAIAGLVALTSAPAIADPPVVRVSVNPLPELRIGRTRPPQPRYERRARFPGWGHTWVAGSWDWQGDEWVWIGGRWERPERHVYWVRARYASEYGHWRYVPGHWSNQQVRDGDDYRQWKEERRHRNDRNHGDRDRGNQGNNNNNKHK